MPLVAFLWCKTLNRCVSFYSEYLINYSVCREGHIGAVTDEQKVSR